MDVALSALGDSSGDSVVQVGIDPGRDKSGWAAVGDGGELLASRIYRSAEARSFFEALASGSFESLGEFTIEKPRPWSEPMSVSEILMGDGTGKNALFSLAQSSSFKVKLVSERGTTLAARVLYWRLHPPRGLWRLVSTKLRKPQRDVDDLAAWAIVLDYQRIKVQSTERKW